ncbi:hypothetical protein ABZX62_04645 [Streptomyces flavidovirens]|uniref:hypothetical protein n=1 Tax=Streptomyces flavidovirens TaxID=67298 RepID=UPI0033BCD785
MTAYQVHQEPVDKGLSDHGAVSIDLDPGRILPGWCVSACAAHCAAAPIIVPAGQWSKEVSSPPFEV